MATIYVKKVWSYNPKKYKFMTYQKAMKEYSEYIDNCLKAYIQNPTHDLNIKTFEVWLSTEI